MKYQRTRRFGIAVLALAVFGSFAQSQSSPSPQLIIGPPSYPIIIYGYKQLHNFVWTSDGCCALNPDSLAEGLDGNLYGTLPSQLGGYGTVVSYSPKLDIFSTIHNFQGIDGSSPQSGLNLGADGNLYGATEWGGAGTTTGYGTVFKVGSSGVTDLHTFNNGTGGAYPWAAPVQTVDGTLFGVTYNGSTPGTAYSISPSGVFTTIANLPSKTQAPLIVGTDGNLYGTTPYGGTANRGTIFKMTPSGAITILHSFDPSTLPNNGTDHDGGIPIGPILQATDGNFYGVTTWGGNNDQGVVYQLTSGGAYKVLHTFKNSTQSTPAVLEGANPTSGLADGGDGYLYGVSPSGGANGYGTLYRLTVTGTSFGVYHNFDKQTGGSPYSTLFLHTNGILYGVTSTGGTPDQTKGVLYELFGLTKPYAAIVGATAGHYGSKVGILGQGFTKATAVQFGASLYTAKGTGLQIVSDTYIIATVPKGAASGKITVEMPNGNLISHQSYIVYP